MAGTRCADEFTVEVKAVEFVFGNKDNVGWWYVMLRYGQDPVSAERKNMFMWTFDQEGGNNGLYMYEFTPGLKAKWPNHGDDARIRYVAAQVAGRGLGKSSSVIRACRNGLTIPALWARNTFIQWLKSPVPILMRR